MGAAGSYNHLIDAILACPATRAMYLRRLRTLLDDWHGSPDNGTSVPGLPPRPDKLTRLVTDTYARIAADAQFDAAKWNTGDPHNAFLSLINVQLPSRKAQLFGVYGPGGVLPLLPTAQQTAALRFGAAVTSGRVADRYIELVNPLAYAVDVSGWQIVGPGAWRHALQPGTVLPGRSSLFLTQDPRGFRARATAPSGGRGLQHQWVGDEIVPGTYAVLSMDGGDSAKAQTSSGNGPGGSGSDSGSASGTGGSGSGRVVDSIRLY